MKKRWKIFWIVCGSMFLIGIICCSVSWGMGTTLTDIAHQFPHGISWVSEDKTYGDPDDDDDDDIDDDQEEDNETDTDDDDAILKDCYVAILPQNKGGVVEISDVTLKKK